MDIIKKKKILISLPKLTPGGTERAASSLANYLAEEGHDVSVLLMFKREKFFHLHSKINLIEPSDFRKRLGKIFFFPFLLIFIVRSIYKTKPDYIVGFGYLSLTTFCSFFYPKTRLILSFRSSPDRVRFPQNLVLNKLYLFAQEVLKIRVNGIIAQTNYAKKVYGKKYPNAKIKVIPNFLREMKNYDFPRENIVVTLGRCVEEKSQEDLLRAFAKIESRGWRLWIIGDGPLRLKLEELAIQLGIGPQFSILGFQKDVDLYLSKCKIFAFTSKFEGFPNGLIEGMANKLAPVSYNCVAGPSDIIVSGENGFLIELGDIDGLAISLQELINNSNLRNSIAERAYEVNTTYDYSKICKEYEDFVFSV